MISSQYVGRPPFTGQNHIELLQRIETREPTFPANIILPEDCLHLLKSLLKRNPADRIPFPDFFNHPFLQGGPNKPPASISTKQIAAGDALDPERKVAAESAPPAAATGQPAAPVRSDPNSALDTVLVERDDVPSAGPAVAVQPPPRTESPPTINRSPSNQHRALPAQSERVDTALPVQGGQSPHPMSRYNPFPSDQQAPGTPAAPSSLAGGNQGTPTKPRSTSQASIFAPEVKAQAAFPAPRIGGSPLQQPHQPALMGSPAVQSPRLPGPAAATGASGGDGISSTGTRGRRAQTDVGVLEQQDQRLLGSRTPDASPPPLGGAMAFVDAAGSGSCLVCSLGLLTLRSMCIASCVSAWPSFRLRLRPRRQVVRGRVCDGG